MAGVLSSQFLNCADFITRGIPIWPGQRVINPAWIRELKQQQQYQFIAKYQRPIFPGSIVIVQYNGASYIVDGQHRYQLMKELFAEGVNLSTSYLLLEIHDCTTNYELVSGANREP